MCKQLLVVAFVKREFELVQGPHELVEADHVVFAGEAVHHAGEVERGSLADVAADEVEQVVGGAFGLNLDGGGFFFARGEAEAPLVLAGDVFVNVFSNLGALGFIKQHLCLIFGGGGHAANLELGAEAVLVFDLVVA